MHATMEHSPKANPLTLFLTKARSALNGGTSPNLRYLDNVQFDEDFFADVTGGQTKREATMQFEVMSMDDLPSVGTENVVYNVSSTLDQYKWVNGSYASHNPYLPEGDDTGRLLIVDDSAYMPHGGGVSIRLIYNIWALRADLALLARHGLAYEDVLTKGSVTPFDDAAKIRQKYLLQNHKALVSLLREHVKVKGQLNSDLLDRVAKLNVDIWVGEEGSIGFKDGTFVTTV